MRAVLHADGSASTFGAVPIVERRWVRRMRIIADGIEVHSVEGGDGLSFALAPTSALTVEVEWAPFSEAAK